MAQGATALETTGQPPVKRARGVGSALRKTLRKPQFWFGATVIIPTLIWYWLFAYQPIILAFRLAVVRYQILDPAGSPFVGLDNFRQLFANPLFLVSLVVLVVVGLLASVVVPAQVSRTQPRVISGGDLGFRVTGTDTQRRPIGALVIRVNGEWVEPAEQVGPKRLTSGQ